MKKMCVKNCLLLLTILGWLTASAIPTVNGVKVFQLSPWGIGIEYSVSGASTNDVSNYGIMVSVLDKESGTEYYADTLLGDTRCEDGVHQVGWNMAKDGISLRSTNCVVSVDFGPKYCVVDLSAGANALSYPVAYCGASTSARFNQLVFKTSKLVLKRMTSGRYVGVFELTQKQWKLVMGEDSNPSKWLGDTKPVEMVTYCDVRGSVNSITESSFFGRLRERTGLAFDFSGGYASIADGKYMWYADNSSSTTHEVGTRLPDSNGLYDVYGNVAEWSNWVSLETGTAYVNVNGGAYNSAVSGCTAFNWCLSEQPFCVVGFRVAFE